MRRRRTRTRKAVQARKEHAVQRLKEGATGKMIVEEQRARWGVAIGPASLTQLRKKLRRAARRLASTTVPPSALKVLPSPVSRGVVITIHPDGTVEVRR